jgi:hypothetical protein
MAIRCPVCKAENATGPTCRRCKADLSLVFALEEQREWAMSAARNALVAGRYEEAQRAALWADHVRRDEASRRLVALAALLRRDHALAWRERFPGPSR